MELRTENEWNYSSDQLQRWRKRPDGSIECESVPQGESCTQQQFKDDCDVNLIMQKFMKTGELPMWTSKSGVYGDFSEAPSYAEAIRTMQSAQDAFMELPAELRLRFANDPQQLMDFLNDPEKLEESVKLGLRKTVEAPVDPVLKELQTLNKNLSEKKAETTK